MYRANLIARNLHASSENRRKQERLFEKEILPLGLKIKEYEPEKKMKSKLLKNQLFATHNLEVPGSSPGWSTNKRSDS